ncbi:cyclic lactone autoinducer peptide [Xanthomonas nasturtii]|uniref:Cyclic lactone autoinducer peptide n=1 Tax=Xanthomonas nasturtii TaxID=1843581 RepID=A0A3E1KP77_9XANT|nr:cyclic lactone autoinducer peptide [Xanthomonas nasturtii]
MSAVTSATGHLMSLACRAVRRNCVNAAVCWCGLHQPKRPVM